MADSTKILEVKDLRISFNVDSGTVKAVRGISFDLYKGKTLCIVGESGSGKSVTSRAILGILAKNAIIEGGEIVYDGKDLLTINEDRFHKIRGSKISMIFQDPLSALNPIMRVGKQLTEPIFLKAKANKREAAHQVRGIRNAIKNTSKAHQIEINPELIKRFEAATIEEFRVKEALAAYERACAIHVRNEEITLNPEQYPSRVVRAAKSYIRKHADIPEEPSQELSLKLTEAESAELRRNFENMIRASYADYVEKVMVLYKAAMDLRDKELVRKVASVGALKRKFPELKKAASCRFAFRDDEDDRIGVFPTSFAKYLDFLKLARKHQTRADAKKAKYKAKGEDVPPLTLKQRAKLPEKFLTPEEATAMLRRLFDELIEHLETILSTPIVPAAYTKTFLAYYREQLGLSKKSISRAEAKESALEIMRQVGIPQPEIRFRQYPFEFSGGMRQRIVIAIALSSRPEILICDEPTTALDVTIQAQILELINSLKKELNLSIIFITHDLGVVANMADDIAVMYAGKIVEYGTVDDIFYDPKHPYTWALLSSMPDLDTKERIDSIPGTPPNMILPPEGDAFAARNKYALAIDYEEEPPLFQISDTHYAATWLLAPDAPEAVPPEIVTARIKRALAKREDAKKAKAAKTNNKEEK